MDFNFFVRYFSYELIVIIMILNDVVANLKFLLIKVYQITEKQSSTQLCQRKDIKVNKHLWIIQACMYMYMKNSAKWLLSFKVIGQFCELKVQSLIRLELPFTFELQMYVLLWIEAQNNYYKQTYSNFIGLVQLSRH